MKLTALSLALIALSSPAMAERINVYWKLEPQSAGGPMTVALKETFFEQRLVPAKLVRLSAPALAVDGIEPVPAGALLFLVHNEAGKTGFCTIKDRSLKNLAKTLFLPIADKRPCFRDSDGDGSFDSSFTVFEPSVDLSPPLARGSIDAAQPIATPAAYEAVDPKDYPLSITLRYQLVGGSKDRLEKVKLRWTFTRPGYSNWFDYRGQTTPDGYQLADLATKITVKSLAGGTAQIEVLPSPGYLWGDYKFIHFAEQLPDNLDVR